MVLKELIFKQFLLWEEVVVIFNSFYFGRKCSGLS